MRTLLAALVFANVLFFAYAQGWLDGAFGLRSIGDREPERLGRQVRPETIRILPMSAASAPEGASAPTSTPR